MKLSWLICEKLKDENKPFNSTAVKNVKKILLKIKNEITNIQLKIG